MPTEIGVLNRITVGDAYTPGATIIAAGTRAITIFVYNNSVLYQLATDLNGNQWNQYDSELSPGYFSFSRNCSGIKFRNFIAGQVAIVSVKMLK